MPTQMHLDERLQEAFDSLWSQFGDPNEAWCDGDGTRWSPVGTRGGVATTCMDEAQLDQIREQCRRLAVSNEFAINGHENRVSYIVGTGHTYRATARKGQQADASLAGSVQAVLDDFLELNAWQRRQQEIVRRRDRDGEVFLRFFPDPTGRLRVRFVEPGQVRTPPARSGSPVDAMGIRTAPHDVETVEAYYIDGQPVPASEVQHRKANVDCNVRRGLPLFYPVLKNLQRAESLLRNMSMVAEIQSAIALIRKHHGASRSGVRQFVAGEADAQRTSASGQISHFRRYGPGTILDVSGSTEYEFPAAGLDAGNFVIVLQAELRAIASRLVMPEFMLTSDASNANYSSTMVAEGPAMKMFARLQAEQMADDLQVLWRAVDAAIEAGRLPSTVRDAIEIQVAAPGLAVRDQLQEAQVFRIEYESGILSPQTWSQRRGLDFDQEQANLRAYQSAQALTTNS